MPTKDLETPLNPESMHRGATAELAHFVANCGLDVLPVSANAKMRDLLLDFIGISAFAAVRAESTPSVRRSVEILDPVAGEATVIGEQRGFSWPYAALLNGFYAHSLDFDDTNRIQTGHPGAPVIAAGLADAERLRVDWGDLLLALVVGYEVGCRVGGALGAGGYDRGFHITGVAGIFGAVASLASLRKFSAEQTEAAFGLALSKASGTMQYLENGSWNKRLHPGFAAHDALVCATMAEAGVTGAAKPFEGRYGLIHSYTTNPRQDLFTRRLGEWWAFLETAVKPYPSCRLTHSAIDAVLELRKGVSEAELANASLDIELSPMAMKIVGESRDNKRRPKTIVDAQFSVYYQVAEAWLRGGFVWSSYDDLDDPVRLALMERIFTCVDDELKGGAARVSLINSDPLLSKKVDTPLGEPENWIGDQQLRTKFMSMAAPCYGERKARAIADATLSLKETAPISDFVRSLRRDEE